MTGIRCNISGSVEFVNYSTDGATYLWDFGAGASPATATGDGPFTVAYSTTGYKTVKLIAFSPIGNDTVTKVNYINVTALAPLAATSISGPTNICTGGSNRVYTVPLISGVTSYNWTVPTGATIVSGSGTRSISVSFITSYTSGAISVTETNGCGTGPAKSLTVIGTPSAPASISGPTNICSLTTATYTVSTVAGVTGYTWSLPSGITTTTGASTVTTSGTSLAVNIAPGATGGTISVTANTTCTGSTPATLAVSGGSAPAAPSSVTGPTNICSITTGTYTVSAVAGATGYKWTLPAGVTSPAGASPVTTAGTSLTVNYGSVTSGTISVKSYNSCSSSASVSISFTSSGGTLAAPGTITGLASVCGVPSTTYSIPAVSGATSYVWTLPAGITSAAGASPVTTTGTSLAVNISPTFVSGNLSVVAKSSCATSAARTKALTVAPTAPALINGPTSTCFLSSATYSIAAISGATSYTWTLPAGTTSAAGTSPITTTSTSIIVDFDTTFTSGTLSVKTNNACTASAARILALVSTPATPAGITGSLTVCPSTTETYSIAGVNGATSYTWTLPAGATSGGVSPVTTTGTSVTVDFDGSFTTGALSVVANSSCASSVTPRTITIKTVPNTPGTISGPTVVCGLTSSTYSIAAVSGAVSYTWTLPSGVTSSAGASPVNITGSAGISLPVDFDAAFNSGTISVVANSNCTSSIAKTLAISKATLAPASITGSIVVCPSSSATYTVAATAGATFYTWTLPTGVTSTAGASPVITTGTSLTVDFASTFSTGTLSVKAGNECANSVARTLAIKTTLATPGAITGPTSICVLTTATYSVAAVAGATGYQWTAPTGVTITSGQGTNSISVSIDANVGSGSLTVKATNACRVSAVRSLALAGCHSYTAMNTNTTEEQSIGESTIAVTMYPNPGSGNFNVEYHSDITSELTIEMFDIQGKRILGKAEQVKEGQNVFNYNESGIQKGMYFIKIADENNNIAETKILIIE
jgi:hypothetical protein